MNSNSTSQSLSARLRETKIADLPLLHELRHRAHGVFNRRVGIDAMLVIKIDVIDAQSLEAGFAASPHVLRLPVHAACLGISGVGHDVKLHGQHHFVSLSLDRLPDQHLVLVRAVDIGCVEKGHAEFDGSVNGGDGFLFVSAAIKLRHAHAAQAKGRYFETTAAEFARFHKNPPRNQETIRTKLYLLLSGAAPVGTET